MREFPIARWFVATVFAALVAFTAPVEAAEEILSYDAVIVVGDDGMIDVTETITVRAEGDQIKRGIYRDFPLAFVDDSGRRHKVSFELLAVARDGEPEPHHTASNSNGVRIYAGEESVFLERGIHTYEIQYRTGRQIRFFSDHAELFWNVTGNEWAFPIRQATADIALPQGRAPVRWTAYTSRFGARGEDFTGRILGDNALQVTTTGPLAPGEGLSVAVEIPAGLIAAPSGAQAAHYWFLDNRRFIFGGVGFLGVLVFYVMTWGAVGRDPPKGTIIPLFRPPEGISPALASYIHNWGWRDRWRPFTAAALSLATKGLIVFDESGDKIVLSRKQQTAGDEGASPAADTDAPPPGERAILHWVDGRGGNVAIDKANGTSLKRALSHFRSALEHENRHRFFRRNLGWFVLGLAMIAAALILTLAFGDLSDDEIGLMIAVGMLSVFFGMLVVPVLRSLINPRSVRARVAAALNIIVLLAVLGFVTSFGASIYRSLPDDFGRTLFAMLLENGFPFVLVGAFAAMNGLFYYLLRAPTASGRKVMDDIEGLDLYIRTAETPRFNAAGAPDLDMAQFERLLPYAVALDAERPWSEAFAKAFARAHPGEDIAAAYAPAWHGDRGWRGGDFSRSIASTVSAAQSSFAGAMPAPKSSSGFSGGGGSGGGGGGGGGGGW